MKKIWLKRFILLVLIVLNCSVIFLFSSDQAEESSDKSGRVVDFVIETAYKNKELTMEKKQSIKENMTTVVRKGAHFSIYSCLGILSYLFAGTYSINKKKRFLYAVLFCFLYACSDELHQMFVDGRSGELRDVCIDTLGAMFGALIVFGISKIVNLIKKK